jgi:hypothetical protein
MKAGCGWSRRRVPRVKRRLARSLSSNSGGGTFKMTTDEVVALMRGPKADEG